MPPVRIKLNDYGTACRLTALCHKERWLSGLYLSFDVWQRMLSFDDGTWLAAIYGGYHDNLVAISVAPSLLKAHPVRPFVLSKEAAEAGNVSSCIASAGFRVLDEEVLGDLGFGSYDEIYAAPERGIHRHFHLHDDFIFFLDPIDRLLLRRALHLTVGVHEHYLGMSLTDSENDRIAALIEKELKLHDEIELRSSPAGQAITITHRVPARRFWRRLFGLTDQVSTEIAVVQGRRRP